MQIKQGNLLEKINSPEDLRKLKEIDLIAFSDQLRQYIIDVVSCNPGHLGASLGVVELTVALHYALNTPYDKIVWDVGHQAYAHKILTGRKEKFHTIRHYGGLSGYPSIFESEYDAFGVGHSSTSISAALGMAAADVITKTNRQVVAVIGDGSMTAGMAFEALNNAGNMKTNLLVILNDNNIAIDPNVGALKDYLTDVATSRTYNKVKDEVWHFLGKLSRFGPNARQIIQKIDNGIKSIVLRHSNLFESLNFRYFGPVDGHDVIYLAKLIEDLKKIPGPKLLHVRTVKGKGFSVAEDNPTLYHAPGLFNKETGERIDEDTKGKPPLYQDVFGETLVELAEINKKVVGITPAMASGCSMNMLAEKFPQRFFDVGIAEQHAVTFSAGLAAQGMIPFCNIYSSFMQRSYDQVIHDVALQNLPVILCLDRAGIVGNDGPTHHGVFDLAYFRPIPNLVISAPINEHELRNLMFTAAESNLPFVIRYPRGRGVLVNWRNKLEILPIGKAELLKKGNQAAVLSIGNIGNSVYRAIQKAEGMGYSVSHYNMRFLKPIDTEVLKEIIDNYSLVFTVEDGCLTGGLSSAVAEYIALSGKKIKLISMGFPDKFIEHGTVHQLFQQYNLHTEGILNTIIVNISSYFNKIIP